MQVRGLIFVMKVTGSLILCGITQAVGEAITVPLYEKDDKTDCSS
jgi:hypothetical protein